MTSRPEPAPEQLEVAARAAASLERLKTKELSARERAVRRTGVALRQIIAGALAEDLSLDALEQLADRCEELAEPLVPGRSLRARAVLSLDGVDGKLGYLDLSPNIVQANPVVPDIEWSIDADRATVVGRVTYGVAHEGPPGCVHGGFVAAAFDEVLGLAQVLSDQLAMTGRLTVRYRRPTPLHQPLTIEGWLVGNEGRKVIVGGRILDPDGEVTAEADGLFITVAAEMFRGLADGA